MRVIQTSGNEVFCLTDTKLIPSYLGSLLNSRKSDSKKTSEPNKQNEDEEVPPVELIQDFSFPGCSGKIRVSADKRYIAACGVYPPQLNVYETDEMSLKFNRKMDNEIVDFLILSDDYKKLVLLEENRSLEFHSQGGRHHIIRVPDPGRCLAYDGDSAELWISTSSPFLYNLDLCEGRYRQPVKTSKSFVERVKVQDGLIYAAGEGNDVEIWDSRADNTAASLSFKGFDFDDNDIAADIFASRPFLTALDVHSNGLLLAMGSSEGVCRVFDIRATRPLIEKDHSFDSRIVDIRFCNLPTDEDSTIGFISADERFIRVSRLAQNNSAVVSFEAGAKINCVEPFPDTGLILTALDQPKMGVHLIPALGMAPAWSPFLDELVLDAHETKDSSIFQRYEFITRADVERLGKINDKITDMLKPHQHGFLILKSDLKMLQRQYRVLNEKDQRQQQLLLQLKQFQENAPMRPRIEGLVRMKEQTEKFNAQMTPPDKNLKKQKYLEKKRARMTDEILGDDRFGALFDTNYLESIERL